MSQQVAAPPAAAPAEVAGGDGRKPTAQDVARAYEVLLGRLPESDAAIASHLQSAGTVLDLVRNVARSEECRARVGVGEGSSPYVHYNSRLDVRGIIQAHENHARRPMPGALVNFLGVAMPIEAMGHVADREGQLDHIPIPANYHADMAEWAAALWAVDLARGTFAMVELGCGWGCWMSNTGVAARARGLAFHLTGIEGDDKHIGYAERTMALNGIEPARYRLIRGVAAARPGSALFPHRQEEDRWGAEPLFGASDEECERRLATGNWDRLRMVPLEEAFGDHARIDLLHMDIQGGEAQLVQDTVDLLTRKVAYLVIGTHARQIEGRIMEILLAAGWQLEVERPAIFDVAQGRPSIRVDGVQGWLNPRLAAP